jgi:hypothetical protein
MMVPPSCESGLRRFNAIIQPEGERAVHPALIGQWIQGYQESGAMTFATALEYDQARRQSVQNETGGSPHKAGPDNPARRVRYFRSNTML